MGTSDILVIVGGLAAIVWVNWYFFLAGRGSVAQAAVATDGLQEVLVRVAGGYDPANIRVRKGTPVRLVFDRQETSGCSEEIVIPEFGIRRFLPAYEQTAIELTPEKVGSFEFTCGMSMLRGKLTVAE
jgi:plastocyanin domain-containing protein